MLVDPEGKWTVQVKIGSTMSGIEHTEISKSTMIRGAI